MTTDLEKQFFDTFGIEPYREPSREYNSNGEICSWYIEYPQITHRHYLELMVLHNIYLETKLYSLDYKSLKEEILQDLIDEQELRKLKKDYVQDGLKRDVQKIFEV